VPKLWTLEIGRTDHYAWRDEAVFVGIVADAGEWTLDVPSIKTAFAEAVETGSSDLFSAPLYVVKDYVKELQAYGIISRAKEAPVGTSEGGWHKRDWKDLAPEQRESAGDSELVGKAEASGKAMQVVILKSDHLTLDGSKGSDMKFRAYMELASDAAKRFAPEEGFLNACHARITGSAGKAVVFQSLTPEAANIVVEQLRKSGFQVEAEPQPAAAKA